MVIVVDVRKKMGKNFLNLEVRETIKWFPIRGKITRNLNNK